MPAARNKYSFHPQEGLGIVESVAEGVLGVGWGCQRGNIPENRWDYMLRLAFEQIQQPCEQVVKAGHKNSEAVHQTLHVHFEK